MCVENPQKNTKFQSWTKCPTLIFSTKNNDVMYRLAFSFLLVLLSGHAVIAQRFSNGWDSVCYALGITWKNDLARNHVQISSAAFVEGITACYHNDTATFSLKKAFDLIEQHEKQLKNDSLPSSLRDSLSYALGFIWARNIYAAGFPCPDTSLLIAGLMSKEYPQFSVEQAKKILNQYLEKIREEEYRGIKLLNENWLLSNKSKPGIVTLPSGVQYKLIKSAVDKRRGSDTSIFVLSYKAMLIDGTIFEQTQRPEKFYLSALIPGLHEILLSMGVGEKREVYIPYFLAFGAGGIKNTVPPFATVIYEIELVDLE